MLGELVCVCVVCKVCRPNRQTKKSNECCLSKTGWKEVWVEPVRVRADERIDRWSGGAAEEGPRKAGEVHWIVEVQETCQADATQSLWRLVLFFPGERISRVEAKKVK